MTNHPDLPSFKTEKLKSQETPCHSGRRKGVRKGAGGTGMCVHPCLKENQGGLH